jgi:filamentous hemagglutinin family protein
MFSTQRILCLFIILTCVFSDMAYADGTHPQGIKLDGSVGTAGKIDLPGPNYAIKPEYGKQAGPNLFHSFQQFNIHSGESATFSGPSSVKNIISRVTGGSASWIDGKLASTIPGADLYFLNPAGVMFGSNASLDLSGSFHVSTADYLKMGDNERFYSKPIENEILSVAAPSAFGFLSEKPGKISVEGASLIGNNLSLIGGDIEINDSAYLSGGITTIEGKGNVSLLDNSQIQADIYIRCGQFIAKNSVIWASSIWRNDGGIVDIQADNISFTDGAYINASTYSYGRGGDIILKAAESVLFAGNGRNQWGTRIEVTSQDSGNAGKVLVEAKNISFTDGASINSSTWGKGKGGGVTLKASETVSFSGEKSSDASLIQTIAAGEGDAGKLTIDAKNISFADGAYINSNTEGKGKGGEVTLKASESVSFAGESSNAQTSGIWINTLDKGEGAGDAGKLMIDAKNISFDKGAVINSSTWGKGKGGDVTLKAAESVSFSGESSKAQRSWIFINTLDKEKGAGAAGKLSVEAENISFIGGSGISSNTEGKGKGGEVTLKAAESVSFSGESSNAKTSETFMDTWDTEAGAGDAGKLTIDAKNICFTNGARIYSNAYGKGKGGEVTLNAVETVLFEGESSELQRSGILMFTEDKEEVAGDAGKLLIEAKNIFFKSEAFIDSSTSGKGKGGEVSLKATETVSFEGGDNYGGISIGSNSWIGTGREGEQGDAGKLLIDAKNISFIGSFISSKTFGKGKGGDVTLKAAETVSFAGRNGNSGASLIETETLDPEEGAGDAGKLSIDANNISFADGAYINSGTYGTGKGGEVTLNAAETIMLSGISSKRDSSYIHAGSNDTSKNAGPVGKISVSAQKLSISDKGAINTSSRGGGQAGDISLNVGNLELSGGASVSSDATNSGGGRITVDAKDTVSLTDSSITTNVAQGTGKGGDITIGNPDTGAGSKFVILNRSHIQANARGEGDGGAVFIQTDNFLKSADSRVTATSARGNEGTVKIEAPDLDISSGLTILPGIFFDASRWASTPCEARSSDEPESRFEVHTHIIRPVPFGE